MRIKLLHDKALVLSGVGAERVTDVEIEVVGVKLPATIRVNGLVYQMSGNKRKVPMRAFGEFNNDVKILSDGKWYVLEGIVRDGDVLRISEDVAIGMISDLTIECDRLSKDLKMLETKVEELQKKCSGEKFL
jgi:hypothetical protein